MRMNVIGLMAAVSILPCVAIARQLKPEVLKAMHNGAMAEIHLKVLDNSGMPVSNASVRAVMDMTTGEYSLFGKTDTNGVYVVRGKTNGNYIEFLVGKDGYYGSRKRMTYVQMRAEHDVIDGKWQPYGAVDKIILRDIRNPIEMSKELFWKFKYTVAINTWIGYDIKENDFVEPYGNGKVSDFEVYIDWNGDWLPAYRGMAVKIRFTEPFGGYYTCDINTDSEFKGPYAASPDSIFVDRAEFSERVLDNGNRVQKHFDVGKCWVVRSRCKVSSDGKLVSANYSVIYDIVFTCKKGGRGGFCITGVFNPTPNDTNLEPKR